MAFLFLALIFGFHLILKSISVLTRPVTSCLSLHFSCPPPPPQESALLSILGESLAYLITGDEWLLGFRGTEDREMCARNFYYSYQVVPHGITYWTIFDLYK